MQRLAGQVAIVTGGAMGIGGATSRRLAEEGAKVLIADIDHEAARANVARIREKGGVAEAIKTDVGVKEQVKEMVERAMKQWGRLDILVNNAYRPSSVRRVPSTEVDEEAWDQEFRMLLDAIYYGCKYAIPHMAQAGKGSIVNISSVHGLLSSGRDWHIYDTAKTAVIGITRQLAVEWGPSGIRVNAICPGLIVTERSQEHFARPEVLRFVQQQYPLRRHGWPVDIANAIVFLCSEEASFITGQAIAVDGGLTIQLQDAFAVRIAQYVREHPEVQW